MREILFRTSHGYCLKLDTFLLFLPRPRPILDLQAPATNPATLIDSVLDGRFELLVRNLSKWQLLIRLASVRIFMQNQIILGKNTWKPPGHDFNDDRSP